MKPAQPSCLLVGELYVDCSLSRLSDGEGLRLGGIAHAARALWALDIPYAIAAIGPAYLREHAQQYFQEIGCVRYIELGEILGAPNMMLLRDHLETGDQGYEDLLRSQKSVRLNDVSQELRDYKEAIVFPGTFNLLKACSMLTPGTRLHLDIAYGIQEVSELESLVPRIETLLISTSSPLFQDIAGATNTHKVWEALAVLSPSSVVLKENRGGARVRIAADSKIHAVPAQIGQTVNSVGVGDVFSATYIALKDHEGDVMAAWRAARVSAAYAQSNDSHLFSVYVKRALRLSNSQMVELGGVSLPWEQRQALSIYLAAPDFTYWDRRAIDDALRSLAYHNFRVRRPVQENDELPSDAGPDLLLKTFCADVDLIGQTSLMFAVPTRRDPGTLVEIGIAIERKMPVVVYDPATECKNTMVVAGAKCYSPSLDECLSAVFRELSNLQGAAR